MTAAREPPPGPEDPLLAEVTGRLAEGARAFNTGQHWEAHEDWEAAWHKLRAAGMDEAAEAIQGLILITAGFENLSRGKPSGFSVQIAKGLERLREHEGWLEDLGVQDEVGFREAVLTAYLWAQARRVAVLDELEGGVPALIVRG